MGAVFREPDLTGRGRRFEPDFIWVTRSSGLITPILIEIEKPSKRWFRGDGRPSGDFKDARDQLNDWRSWFARDGNETIFREKFLFLSDKYEDRPLEPRLDAMTPAAALRSAAGGCLMGVQIAGNENGTGFRP